MTLSRLIRLKAGLHPIEIDYFEGYGENILAVEIDRLDVDRSEKNDAAVESEMGTQSDTAVEPEAKKDAIFMRPQA